MDNHLLLEHIGAAVTRNAFLLKIPLNIGRIVGKGGRPQIETILCIELKFQVNQTCLFY